MGTLSSMASHCSSDHGRASDYDILGTSGLVGQIKGYLYGNYILSAGTWIYLCKYPVWTLCGAMTQDIDERAKINTSRSVSAMVAIGIINIITVPLIGKLGSQSAKTGYLLVAIIYGCIFAACHFFCFAKTKEQVIMPEKEKISIKVQLRAVMQNRPIYSGINRTGVIRIYTLWKKCRCFILFHLCRGKCILLYYIFHVHYHSIHYRCCMFPACIPQTEQ